LSDFPVAGCLIGDVKSDAQLLREYAGQGNDAAFREIVLRHTHLVYSAALRQVESADLARDVAQNVFTALAHKARSLAPALAEHASLVGWLYRGTRFEAVNLRRNAQRRRLRERQAMEQLLPDSEPAPDWGHLRPVLDEAMADLSEADREAVLLRFFKDHQLRDVGVALGISDDAAQKRVSRALEKLREALSRRGIATATGTLAILITANAVQSAPAGLATALVTTALAASAIPTSTALSATKIIAMTTLQKTIIGAALAAAVGTGLFKASQVAWLRQENQRLSTQQEQLAQERDAALANATARDDQLQQLQRDQNDLLRLRAEVGALRNQTNALARLQQANRQLQAALAAASQSRSDSDPESDPQRLVAIAKMNDAKLLNLGLLMYATDHQDRLPTELNQTSNYWNNSQLRLTGTNQFEFVGQGSLQNIANAGEIIFLRETSASFVNGKWVKAYGFADGHAEIKTEPPEGFDAWEKQHMQATPDGH
jgi:RNA polymerase sigma factor (sigma-70 family)